MSEVFDLNKHLKKYAQRYKKDLEDSLAFLDWLNKHQPSCGKPTLEWHEETYRIVYGNLKPLSIAGSLSAGGRFNIGGAQVSALFPNFAMRACLYSASSSNCAHVEAGEFIGNAQEYLLKPKQTLAVWDVKTVIEKHLPYPELKAIVDASPLAARWELQKVPKVSQILAHYLRRHGGDGLLYPSTKASKHFILAFFIDDDPHAERLFSSRLM